MDVELVVDRLESCLAPLTFASHAYEDVHMLMPVFACRKWEGVARAKEHHALKWVRPLELLDYPMPPADTPVVAALREWL